MLCLNNSIWHYADRFDVQEWIGAQNILIIINKPTYIWFNEIYNFIEVYNNSVIELIQCFGTSFFGRIDHLVSSVLKHCIRSKPIST